MSSSTSALKQLPRDIASVVSHGQTYIFFINEHHELAYLVTSSGDSKIYEHHVVSVTNGVDNNPRPPRAKCGTVAAVAWDGQGDHEIRIYYIVAEDGDCSKRGYVQEVAYNLANKWELGNLGYDEAGRHWVDSDASLSACALVWPDKADLKVFASGKDDRGNLKLTKFFFDYAEEQWVKDIIPNRW
ncbi:hypothetical protein FBEOM_9548 [Fusarium beomiforme]|uniref:Fucose-specific lectin n=1 Tax=Fusarium beomiforme TaxID=44412 RepID=A0A9P5AD59_9HYPO|nr:hypothetical protein FBEOM_9548 [Fusarium beomiforme]